MFSIEYFTTIEKVQCVDLELTDNSDYVVWWYGGFEKSDKPDSQPRLVFLLRKVDRNGGIYDFKRKTVGMINLGFLRIGSVWKKNVCVGRLVFEQKFFRLDYAADKWRYVSLHTHPEHEIFLEHYELKYSRDLTWLIEFSLETGGHLLIPCIEFFARLYGRSQECMRVLATYGNESEPEICTVEFGVVVFIPTSPVCKIVSLS